MAVLIRQCSFAVLCFWGLVKRKEVYICICLLVGIISVKLEMSISPSMLTRCRYGQCLLNCNRYLTGSESIQYAE